MIYSPPSFAQTALVINNRLACHSESHYEDINIYAMAKDIASVQA